MNSSQEKNESVHSSEFHKNLEVVRQIYFFAGLPLESLKVFAYICTREKFKQGEYLFRQKDDDGQAFYILSGEAGLMHEAEGVDQTVREYKSGEFLGGMALLGEMHRLYSLKALTDVTCLIMTREKFRSTMQQFPDLLPRITRSIVETLSTREGQFLSSYAASCDVCKQVIGFSLI